MSEREGARERARERERERESHIGCGIVKWPYRISKTLLSKSGTFERKREIERERDRERETERKR